MEAWESLAVRAQAGDRVAADELFRRLRPVLVRIARKMQVAGQEAEDLAQIGLVRVWRGLGRYIPPRSFGAWAETVGRRAMISAARRTRPAVGELDAGGVADRPPSDVTGEDLPAWWVWEVMADLTDLERADLAQRFGLAGSHAAPAEEVARTTDRRGGAVRKEIRNSLEVVRTRFETLYGVVA